MIKGAFNRFRSGLRKTREGVVGRLQSLFGGRVRLDEDTLEQIEELLISADMGVKSAVAITRNIEQRLKEEGGEATLASVLEVIRTDVKTILTTATPRVVPLAWADLESGGKKSNKKSKKSKKAQAKAAAEPAVVATGPEVIFVVGVNGTGKTTSIAKLAHQFKLEGRNVLLAAGDTFRAAAVEQLEIWAERVGVDCVRQGAGADPAAVVFDALSAAEKRGTDVVIVVDLLGVY